MVVCDDVVYQSCLVTGRANVQQTERRGVATWCCRPCGDVGGRCRSWIRLHTTEQQEQRDEHGGWRAVRSRSVDAIVLASAFVMGSTIFGQFLVCCFAIHGAPRAQPFVKVGARAPCALWSQRHWESLADAHGARRFHGTQFDDHWFKALLLGVLNSLQFMTMTLMMLKGTPAACRRRT